MARFVPHLDLTSVQVTRPRKSHRLSHSSSSSTVVCFTPPTLESSFDPVPRQGSSRYRRKLEELQPEKDYLLLYRLNAEGQLIQVVRRHAFPPIDLEKMHRVHNSPLRLKALSRLSQPVQEAKSKESSPRNGSIAHEKKETRTVTRVVSSVNLLAAKRLLSTTLSLEYGADSQKVIKPNSTAQEFVEYYQQRYDRHFPRLPPANVSLPVLPQTTKPTPLRLKYVKVNERLGRVLSDINASREEPRKHRPTASTSALEKILGRKVSPQADSQPRPTLSLPQIEAEVQKTQLAVQPLRLKHARIKARVTANLQELVRQIDPMCAADTALSPPH